MDNRIMAAIGIVMVFVLVAGLAWCVGNLISARNEERRTRPVPEVDYAELQRVAEVAEIMAICREAAV